MERALQRSSAAAGAGEWKVRALVRVPLAVNKYLVVVGLSASLMACGNSDSGGSTVDGGTTPVFEGGSQPDAQAPLPEAGAVDASDAAPPDPNQWVEVSGTWDTACALRANGTIQCWPEVFNSLVPQGKTFTRLVGGANAHCALDTDGFPHCFGTDPTVKTQAPQEAFTDVAVGAGYACGIRASDGTVRCWGSGAAYAADQPPSGAFTKLAAKRELTCGIRVDKSISCWGTANSKWVSEGPPTGSFKDISVSGCNGACALREDGTLTSCLGFMNVPQPTPASEFAQVQTACHFGCGLRKSGELECWSNDPAQYVGMPTSGTFTAIGAGQHFICVVGTDNKIQCFGEYYNVPVPN